MQPVLSLASLGQGHPFSGTWPPLLASWGICSIHTSFLFLPLHSPLDPHQMFTFHSLSPWAIKQNTESVKTSEASKGLGKGIEDKARLGGGPLLKGTI